MIDKNKKEKLLLVEDEETLAVGLEYNLREEGYDVDWAEDGKKALEYFEKKHYDMIILDIMLPYFNGFEIAETVRKKLPQMPILMLTARTKAEDKVKGLELGADDYMIKPFHLQELLLRIKGMLKRKNWYVSVTENEPLFKFDIYEINFENFKCRKGKTEFQLTAYEAMVLKYLVDNREKVISRKELLEKVWHLNPEIETRTVDNFIARLRKYFENDPSSPEHILSVRGAGYMFSE